MENNHESEYPRRPDAKGHLRVLKLLREWDPIGVISDTHQNEYDTYAPRLIRLLDAHCTHHRLAEELRTIRTQDMGLRQSPVTASEKQLAEALVHWWTDWKTNDTPLS